MNATTGVTRLSEDALSASTQPTARASASPSCPMLEPAMRASTFTATARRSNASCPSRPASSPCPPGTSVAASIPRVATEGPGAPKGSAQASVDAHSAEGPSQAVMERASSAPGEQQNRVAAADTACGDVGAAAFVLAVALAVAVIVDAVGAALDAGGCAGSVVLAARSGSGVQARRWAGVRARHRPRVPERYARRARVPARSRVAARGPTSHVADGSARRQQGEDEPEPAPSHHRVPPRARPMR